jgi:hypothetical protein
VPKRLILTLAVVLIQASVFLACVGAESLPPPERRKIEALIEMVAAANDIKFVRNGSAYNAATAATFLRRKWQANAGAVSSARDFIEKVASASGTSGKPYLIRFQDGSEIQSKQFLLAELTKMERLAEPR